MTSPPRIGCLGFGWIARSRIKALIESGAAELVAVADPDPAACVAAQGLAPDVRTGRDLGDLLELELDGIVVATPSAQHALQARAALQRGMAVFCEKPLGRDPEETASVVTCAARADRLLAVDLSYRHLRAITTVHAVLAAGGIGTPYAADLVFHNAYGPDRSWYSRRELAGGGCLIDLGTHLLDLLVWLTGAEDVLVGAADLRRGGARIDLGSDSVEDLAVAHLRTDGGVVARLACSWWLPAGCDCVFQCALYGTEGGLAVHNVDGSFYDFRAERRHGTRCETVAEPGDDWSGAAIVDWARRLAHDPTFDPDARRLLAVSGALQDIYEAAR